MNFQEEYIKCFKDKTRQYFIENYLSTFNASERKEVPFHLFPRQIAFLNSLAYHTNTVAIKPRQAGITTVSSAWITGQIVFASKKSPETILCLGNKLDISEQLVEKIVNFLDQVPRWMWGSDFYSPDPDSPKNTKSIYKKRNKNHIELFNGCKVYARSSGENAARGISAVSVLIVDECAFVQNGPAVYAQAVAATASVDNARIILVSTPNGKDPLYYKVYESARRKANNFNAVEFRWFQDPRYNRFLEWYRTDKETNEIEWNRDTVIDKKGNIEYNEERWRNLEREGWKPTAPWYKDMCKSFNNDAQKIAQELDVSFLGSADNVISPDIIEAQRRQNVIEITDDWELKDNLSNDTWIWKDPIPGHRYVCACLPEGEKILTDKGLINVENVKDADLLITKEGNFSKIKCRKYRYVKNEEIVNLKLHGCIDTHTFTHNHKIWSSTDSKRKCFSKLKNKIRNRWWEWQHDFDYVESIKLKKGDWVQIPNIYFINEINEKELLKYWKEYDFKALKKVSNPLLEEDFWWFCGIWLAEGFNSPNTNRIETSHHINEKEYHTKIVDIIKRLFNRKAVGYDRPYMHSTTMYFNSSQVQKFLNDNFGKYANNKYIAEWIKYIPNKYKIKLLEGYFDGDGHYGNDGVSAISSSKQLMNDIQDILYSCGIISNVCIKKGGIAIFGSKESMRKESYRLKIGKFYSKILLEKFGKHERLIKITDKKYLKSYSYFSDDLKYIYLRIAQIEIYLYEGKVYNFETVDVSHSYCCRNIATHNCDPSSGAGNDYTSIQVIDIDGTDEESELPYFEQVLEYKGKITGDEIAELLFRYGSVYNNALVVIESLGGYGDAAVLQLMNMKYSNLYYDDPGLKTYVVQQEYQKFGRRSDGKLPGFRTNGKRIQMLANLANLIKSNALRIRSIRVINELETWVWKNGRPDHQEGSNDDSLTCLAMGLFVAEFSMLKSEKQKAKDSSMLRSWKANNSSNNKTYDEPSLRNSVKMNPSSMKINPFVNDYKRKERKHMSGCLMLGGFFSVKKN